MSTRISKSRGSSYSQTHRKSTPSTGIKDFFETKLAGDKLKPNIYNLDEYFAIPKNANANFNRDYYLRCKQFIEGINKKVGDDLDKNDGNICDVHPFISSGSDSTTSTTNTTTIDDKDIAELEKIRDLYQRYYLEGLTDKDHFKNKKREVFPFFYFMSY